MGARRSVWIAILTGLLATALAASCVVADDTTPGAPAPTQPVLPAWAQVQEQTIPADYLAAVKTTAQKFFDQLKAGNKDAAVALLAPESASAPGPDPLSFYDPRQLLTLVTQLSDPVLVDPGLVGVRAYSRWQGNGPMQGRAVGKTIGIYFRMADKQPLIYLAGAGAPPARDLATAVPEGLFWPWWETTRMSPDDPGYAHKVASTLGLISTNWPSWDNDPDKCWANVQAWWAAQDKLYGTYRVTSMVTAARLVAMSGDSEIVDRPFSFVSTDKQFQVTYRFRMVRTPPPTDPHRGGRFNGWQIADICTVSVQALPAPPPMKPTATAAPE